jgi:hypothetical protein
MHKVDTGFATGPAFKVMEKADDRAGNHQTRGPHSDARMPPIRRPALPSLTSKKPGSCISFPYLYGASN